MGKNAADQQVSISEEQYTLLANAMAARHQVDQRIAVIVGAIVAGHGISAGTFLGIDGKPKHRVLLYRRA